MDRISIGTAGGCVVLDTYMPTVETSLNVGKNMTQAYMLDVGHKIALGTESLEDVVGEVKAVKIMPQPCVRIVTADGISLVCSTTAPILTQEQGFVYAPNLLGMHVAVKKDQESWFDKVVEVTPMGVRFVRLIDTGNNSFWAGEDPNAGFILHHNKQIVDYSWAGMDLDFGDNFYEGGGTYGELRTTA